MKSCKKPVYKVMCEADKGERHGRYRAVRYESVRKRASARTKGSKGTAKAVPKTQKVVDPWTVMDRGMFVDDAPEVIDYDFMDTYDNRMQSMYRDEQLRRAYTAMRTRKRRSGRR